MTPAAPPTPVDVASAIVGDAWTNLVLREAVLLGTRRFVDFRDSLRVNRATLVARLGALVDAGLLTRESVSLAGDRSVYVPTARSQGYLSVLLSMLEWGRRWEVDPGEGQLLRVTHESCGAMLATAVTCAVCRGPIDPRSVDAERGAHGVGRPPADARMPRLDQLERGHRCPIARCLSGIGDRWSMLIIQEAFFGVRQFDVFTRRLGIAPNILSNRLVRLCEHSILERRANGGRHDYRLTEKGLDLYRVPATVRQWAIQALDVADPLRIVHRWCGANLAITLRCIHCGGAVHAGTVHARWPDEERLQLKKAASRR